MTSKCSPKYENGGFSCFTKPALLKIIQAYNRHHRADPIDVDRNSGRQQIWNAIQMKLAQRCGNDESCWIEQDFAKNEPELADFFKPLAPLGQYQWLTTDDIYNVMHQYEEKYPHFKFVGPLPIDFMELTDADSRFLQNLNLNRSKYSHIGIIFNLDPSTKSGSHWVAMHINRDAKVIAFFDSYGNKHTKKNAYKLDITNSFGEGSGDQLPIPTEIQAFINQLIRKSSRNGGGGGAGTAYKIKANSIQHQYANSECGIYSMMFILQSLDRSFEDLTQDIVVDEMANQLRKKFFRRP